MISNQVDEKYNSRELYPQSEAQSKLPLKHYVDFKVSLVLVTRITKHTIWHAFQHSVRQLQISLKHGSTLSCLLPGQHLQQSLTQESPYDYSECYLSPAWGESECR